MNNQIVLPKGESIHFLDYIIMNCLNNDGLVLFKQNSNNYEYHLGNFGIGTQENIDNAKKFATLFFMVARPEEFATTVVNKMWRLNSGTQHEYFKLKNVCEKENIQFPTEITCGNSVNCMIYFNGKPLAPE